MGMSAVPLPSRLELPASNKMEEPKRDRKKEKQKTDETRNNLGKAWVAYKGVCAGSLQEFVNHLLAVHELYCHNSRDRQQAKLAEEEGEDLEEGETAPTTSPKNRKSRHNKDDQSSVDSQSDGHQHGPHCADQAKSETSTHSEGSHPPRRLRTTSEVSRCKSTSRSRSRSLSRTRQLNQSRAEDAEAEVQSSEDEFNDDKEPEPSGSGTNSSKSPIGICVRGLPIRSTDSSLKEGLYHKFKKYGKITSVHVTGEGEARFAVISFTRTEDAKDAMESAESRLFFGSRIELALHEGFEPPASEDFTEPDCNEYHAKATRTLFVRNLDSEIRVPDLRTIFKAFGKILDIDIKRQGSPKYAFIQYTDITSVCRARREMDDKRIGSLNIKTGFGKSLPTKCVWLDNVAEQITEKYLCQQFSRYGAVCDSVVDRAKGKALIFFEGVEAAQYAVNEMRMRVLYGKKIMIDFASQVCEKAFFKDLERAGVLPPGSWSVGRGQRTQSAAYFSGRDGYGSQTKGRQVQGRSSPGDRQYGYSNAGPGPAPGRTVLSAGRTATQAGYTFRAGHEAGGRPQGFPDRAYQDPDSRDRRQGYYSDYGPEPGLHREESFEDIDYNYRKADRRSLSPPRKRRALQGDLRNNRPPGVTRENDSRYMKQYQDRYPSPPPRDRDDRYKEQYTAHFSDPDTGTRQTGRSVRSFYSEPHREYRPPPYDDKLSAKEAFSPARSSSDFTQRSPSPDRGEL